MKVDQPLRPLSNKLRLQIVCPTGKASQTEFELISYNGKSSVVKCKSALSIYISCTISAG